MMYLIRKISYNPIVIGVVRFFGLRPVLRKLYYRLARPSDGILQLEMGGVKVEFPVSKPEELRTLEASKQGEEEVWSFLVSHLEPGDVVYDIGANIGFYTVLLSKVVGERGRVIAFEPEKGSCQSLRSNSELNNLNNVQIFEKALGEKAGEADLSLGKRVGNFSLVETYGEKDSSQKVEVVNGDRFVKEQELPVPRAVKIDVEGYEYSVLRGLRSTLSNPDCKLICCEVHPPVLPEGVTEEKISELIRSFGFEQFEIYKKVNTNHLLARKE